MRFAMNHIVAPRLPLPDFLAMVRRLGITEVEIRNDIPDVITGWKPAAVRRAAADAGVTLISINALYPFNLWQDDLPDRAARLADYAAEAGVRALVLCPLNDGRRVEPQATAAALGALAGLLRERGLAGLVEPLGFPVSSMRTLHEGAAAIDAAGAADVFTLLHDTFHHHLAGETGVLPQRIGLVHLSGVTEPGLATDAMLDRHRGLVDAQDRVGNVAQVRELLAAGYEGAFSFEPFSPAVHDLPDPEAALRATMDFIAAQV